MWHAFYILINHKGFGVGFGTLALAVIRRKQWNTSHLRSTIVFLITSLCVLFSIKVIYSSQWSNICFNRKSQLMVLPLRSNLATTSCCSGAQLGHGRPGLSRPGPQEWSPAGFSLLPGTKLLHQVKWDANYSIVCAVGQKSRLGLGPSRTWIRHSGVTPSRTCSGVI